VGSPGQAHKDQWRLHQWWMDDMRPEIGFRNWNQVKYKPQYQTSNRSIKTYYNTKIFQHKKSFQAWELKHIPIHKENIIPKKVNVPVSSVNTCSGDHLLFGSNSTRPLKKSTNARQSAFSVSEQNWKKWIYRCTSIWTMMAMIFFWNRWEWYFSFKKFALVIAMN